MITIKEQKAYIIEVDMESSLKDNLCLIKRHLSTMTGAKESDMELEKLGGNVYRITLDKELSVIR